MTVTIWETIADTPWWFFLVVVSFFYMAWLATKPRVVAIKILFAMPAVYIPFSLIVIYFTLTITTYLILTWISGAMTGMALGWLQFKISRIKAIKNEPYLYVPGTWGVFLLLLLIAASKYYYGYSFFIDPQLIKQAEYTPYFIGLYGLFAGLFIGKLLYALRCTKVGPYFSTSS